MAEQGHPAEQLTNLRGQVAIVTGASSGIGEAITEALTGRGVKVAVQARRAQRLEELGGRIEAAGRGQLLVVPGDVRNAEDVQALVDRTIERWGHLDIVVANAGFGYRKLLVEGDIQIWKDMLDTNVYGLLLTLKYGVKPMLDAQRGHVVVTSSVAGIKPTPSGSAYCGSKAAASFIADCLRQEVASQGVRVTTIEPGVVISEFQEVAQYTPEIVANMLKGAVPLYPVDIARAVVFALEQPENVGISELVIRPSGQAYP